MLLYIKLGRYTRILAFNAPRLGLINGICVQDIVIVGLGVVCTILVPFTKEHAGIGGSPKK